MSREREVESLRAELEASSAKGAALARQLAALEAQASGRADEAERNRAEVDRAQAEVRELHNRFHRAQKELEEARSRLASAEQELAAARAVPVPAAAAASSPEELRVLGLRVQELSGALQVSKRELAAAVQKCQAVDQERAELSRRVASLQAANLQLTNRLQAGVAPDAEAPRLRGELEAARAAAASLEGENRDLARKVEGLTKDCERQLAAIQRLQQEARRAAAVPFAAAPEPSSADPRLQQLETALREEKRTNLKLQALYTKLKRDCEDKGVSEAAFERLWQASSVEFDKDYAENKYKQAEARARKLLEENQVLRQRIGQQPLGNATNMDPAATPSKRRVAIPSTDKENIRAV